MGFWDFLRRDTLAVTESKADDGPSPDKLPARAGFEYGIPSGGIDEYSQGIGASTQSDRRTMLTQLYEVYLSCPWSWASVNAISRTITAGGLITDWDTDSGEGDEEIPEKPPEVIALERLLKFCNPQEDMRQLLRGVIADLQVFGDAYIEVVWLGGIPVALYSLDCPSTFPKADQHGTVSGYVQVTEFGQRAEFEPHEVIHISLDSPRSGVFGVSPTQAAQLPITAWLFTAATLKETFRKGNPPLIHVDMPQSISQPEMNKWVAQYMQRNVGPRNIGMPVLTKGGADVKELKQNRIEEYLQTLDQKRDEIIATYGVPPAEVCIIESGNLGGGTGEAQHKTFTVNTCQPIGEVVLEKLNYYIVRRGFGITDWRLKFGEVDMRDSKVVEEIRDMRLRNGSWTLNKYRADIAEPPVDGGEAAVMLDRQNVVAWRDMDAYSKAGIAAKLQGTALEPDEPGDAETPLMLLKPEPEPVPEVLKPFAGADGTEDPPPDEDVKAFPGAVPVPADEEQENESWIRQYRTRLSEALRVLPDGRE